MGSWRKNLILSGNARNRTRDCLGRRTPRFLSAQSSMQACDCERGDHAARRQANDDQGKISLRHKDLALVRKTKKGLRHIAAARKYNREE